MGGWVYDWCSEDYEDLVAQFLGERKLNNRQTVKENLRNKAFHDLPQEITTFLCPAHIFVNFFFVQTRFMLSPMPSPLPTLLRFALFAHF